MSDSNFTEIESGGLKKSLRLSYVYAIAAGAIAGGLLLGALKKPVHEK